jgi:beta-lactam-binding protein with PASTA domain/tRNA A-37 threonylcarbamoyl transferase component Bud32
MSFAPGTTINDRYELGRQLGAGGMARVYLAHDRLLDREVAVKVLAERYSADPAFVERFRREASAAAGLNHPNIVSVYDRGQVDHSYYIVMEYLAGPDLKEIVRRRGPLPPGEAVDYAMQMLAALGAAHRRDVVHRDVKPQNVMVAEHGHLKVTDFGIARAGAQSEMTEVGSVIGTAQYLSPEQARGEEVTAASDTYSVGIVLYEMLTGRVPFDGERPMVVAMKQVNEPPVPPSTYVPEIPPELEQVVLRALAKRPADRYRTADEFRAALEEVRVGLEGGTAATRAFAAAPATAATQVLGPREPAPPTRVAPIPPPEPPPRRRWPIVLGILVLLALAGIAAALLLGGDESVTVPRVTGLQVAQAEQALADAGLESSREQVTNAAQPGTVVGSDPAEGAEVDEGSTVTLRVSQGPGTAPVPGVVGRTVEEATQVLEAAGFRVPAPTERENAQPAGTVIAQTPEGGDEAPLDSGVQLVVSTGPPLVEVPSVTGNSVDDATALLEEAGLQAGEIIEEDNDQVEPGQVFRQDPGPGEEVPEGSPVALTVASAPSDLTVPEVTGFDVEDATAELESQGFVVVTEGASPPGGEPEGVVLRTFPAAGQSAPEGTTVRVVFSTGSGDEGDDG